MGELILSFVMQCIFLLLSSWNISVLFGNLLGSFAALLNFFLMCLTVIKAVSMDADKARQRIRASQMLRLLMLAVFAAAGVLFDAFNTVAALLPLFFPRIIILFYQLTHRNGNAVHKAASVKNEIEENGLSSETEVR